MSAAPLGSEVGSALDSIARSSLEPLALSTMYAQRWPDAPAHDLEPFFAAGRALGFERFELSHILGNEAVERVVSDGHRIEIVHHPCPAGAPLEPGDEFTSVDPEARLRAARGLERSLETAARVGAKVVVLHLGRASDAEGEIRRLCFELTARFHSGGIASPQARAARERLQQLMDEVEPASVDRALEALTQPLAVALRIGVSVGIETGYHPDELPTPEGMRAILGATDPDVLGAWLDTGHVGARAALGVASGRSWWTVVGERWLGAHLHDVVGLRDHLAPGTGTVDFQQVLSSLPAGCPLTCEFDWYLHPDEVLAGARHLLRSMPIA